MPLDETPDVRDLRAEVREFAQGAAPVVAAAEEEGGDLAAARRALDLLADANLIAWAVPARDGGRKTDLAPGIDRVSVRALCAVRHELAYASGMLDVVFVMQGLGSYALALEGSKERRGVELPAVVAGKRIPGFALTESGAGSNLSQIATRAERTDSGWRVTGEKTFISNAGIADFYTLLARTSGDPDAPGEGGGLSMFLLPAAVLGVEARPFEVLAPHPIGDLILDDVRLPAEALIGEEGAGLDLALSVLGTFRTSVAAAACGFSRRALDESLGRLAERKQFGKPLSAFQGLRFDVAEMDVRLRAGELLVAEAAELVDDGSAAATRAVARAKLFATESASWICDRAVQHFGGLGVKRGEVVERLFREVRALRIYEGTSEVQKLILAKELFGRRKD